MVVRTVGEVPSLILASRTATGVVIRRVTVEEDISRVAISIKQVVDLVMRIAFVVVERTTDADTAKELVAKLQQLRVAIEQLQHQRLAYE